MAIAACLPFYTSAEINISNVATQSGGYHVPDVVLTVPDGMKMIDMSSMQREISPGPSPSPNPPAPVPVPDPHQDGLPIPDDQNDYARMKLSTEISGYKVSENSSPYEIKAITVPGGQAVRLLEAKTVDSSDNNISPVVAKGEMVYTDVNGVEHSRPYEVSTDSAEETFEALRNMKEQLRQEVFPDAAVTSAVYGSIAAPKAWSADTTVGEIHGRQVNGTTEFFEAKFNGNAKSKNWYYPENKKDNAWWRVVHPKEYYAITSDWHFGAETTSTPYNTVPSKGNFKKIDAINTLKDKYGDAFRGTIINGDITHWGHGGEWSDAKKAFGKLNAPYWYGLGNHDYDGNVNDCGLWENRCAIRSIRNLVDHINSLKDVVSVDYDVMNGYKFPHLSTNYIGSFGYSFDIAGIRFIQLNNNLHYTKEFSGFNSDAARRYDVKVRDGEGWFREQLRDAGIKGKATIALEHGGESYSENETPTRDILGEYGGSIRFGGHSHGISSSNSGAAYYGDMLILELDYNKQMGKTYMVSNDKIDEMSPGAEFTLNFNVPEMAPVPKSYILSLRNKGGYTGYYRLTYTNSSTKANFNKEYKLSLGNTQQVIIPAEATNVKIKGVTGTGRALYSQSLTKQENTCIETWGTLPRNLHWGWCK